MPYKAHKAFIRRSRPYKGYKAIKGLERPGGGPRERYPRLLHQDSFKGLETNRPQDKVVLVVLRRLSRPFKKPFKGI